MSSMSGRRGMGGQKDIIPKGYNKAQMSNFTPEMMKLFKKMFSGVSSDSYTSKLAQGDESLFEEMERPAMRQFGALQGDIASRFSGMGMGSRHGSGFENSMDQATSDFAQDLQSKRQELQRNAISDLHGMSKDLLGQKPYEKSLVKKEPKKPSFWSQFAQVALPAAGMAADYATGNTSGTFTKGGTAAAQGFR